jgi:hypothetical protein
MHPPSNHTDFVNAHKISEKPTWISVWDSFLAANLTSVKESWAWPAQRLDLAYLHEKAILPLASRITELEAEVGGLIGKLTTQAEVNAAQSQTISNLSNRLATLEARPPSTGTGTLPPGSKIQLGQEATVL